MLDKEVNAVLVVFSATAAVTAVSIGNATFVGKAVDWSTTCDEILSPAWHKNHVKSKRNVKVLYQNSKCIHTDRYNVNFVVGAHNVVSKLKKKYHL